MKQSFLNQLKNAPSITVRQLQSKIINKNQPPPNHFNTNNLSANPSDLKIISPFYERLNHRPDCSCKYHKRIKRVIPLIKKIKTEGNQAQLPHIRNTLPIEEQQEQSESDKKYDDEFEKWVGQLNFEDVKKYYFQYLKTLPKVDKFKRLDKLDCHNQAFEQFLKNNFLIILQKTKEQNKQERNKTKQKESSANNFKSSHKVVNKMITEGNIYYESATQSNFKKDLLSYKDSISYKDSHFKTFESSQILDAPSSTLKLKKIAIKGTGRNLQNIGQEQIKYKKQSKKKAKFMNSRPSFFGLIEDQELLKQLCMKLMNQNRRANKQAEFIVKKLVQSDIDMYQKMIIDLQGDLQAGIKLRNLNQDQANILIKIVLNKIQQQTQKIKVKDQHYEHKNSLIQQLCNKYGWPKEDTIIQLRDFWKMRQQKLNSNNSRHSIINGRSSRSKISKNNIDSKQNKKIKSKVTIQQDTQLGRMSGFNSQKIKSQNINSVKFMTNQQIQQPKTSAFKFTNTKPLSKMAFYKSKQKRVPKKNLFHDSEFKSSLEGSNRKPFGIARRSNLYDSFSNQKANNSREEDDIVIEIQTFKQIAAREDQDDLSSRNSSLYLNLKNHVQRHIELNKRFLKRIQHDLADNDCERLIIGMGQGIITKKRKIRAIHEALQTQQIKKSSYYDDILKYLEIYEDYCDLVVRVKREEKISKTYHNTIHYTQHFFDKQKQQDQVDINSFIDSLKYERELKYMDLTLLKEEQDPKEELILKIPQYTTQIQRVKIKCPKISYTGQMISSSNQSGAISQRIIKNECNMLQKDLDGKVKLECQNNWYQKKQQTYKQQRSKQILIIQSRIEHYRNIFKGNSLSK